MSQPFNMFSYSSGIVLEVEGHTEMSKIWSLPEEVLIYFREIRGN